MTEIPQIAPSHAPRAVRFRRQPSASHQTTCPRQARARLDTMAIDWCRLRTILDALLHRVAALKADATAIVPLNTTPEEQERLDG
jgi:hypothetical protein